MHTAVPSPHHMPHSTQNTIFPPPSPHIIHIAILFQHTNHTSKIHAISQPSTLCPVISHPHFSSILLNIRTPNPLPTSILSSKTSPIQNTYPPTKPYSSSRQPSYTLKTIPSHPLPTLPSPNPTFHPNNSILSLPPPKTHNPSTT